MFDSDTVVIDDDNDVIILSDSNHAKFNNKPHLDMIVIDDVEDLTQNTIIDIIEIDDESDLRNKNNQLKFLCDRIYRENNLLKIFVEKCLDLENTDGMLRVINRTLLHGYRETTKDFKKSPELENTLKKAINLIEADPDHKFSHVKLVCEVFKKHRLKKRVNFVTLTPLLKGSVRNKRPKTISAMKKIPKTDIVDADSPVIFEVPIINLEEDENLSNIQDKSNITEIILDEVENENSNKENHLKGHEVNNPHEVNKNIEVKNNKDIDILNTVNSKMDKHIPNSVSSELRSLDASNPLLVAQRDEEYTFDASDSIVMEQVKQIEKQIAFYKDAIAELEEEEVLENTLNSPYIKCEKMKTTVTKLYKKMCLLTGDEPVKRREVRLNVADGHPPGPVRELEKFINERIGRNGEPPFPNFYDVMKCVIKANRTEGLGWKSQQVMREANLLFVQCGRALQKRRQRREWRDMLGRVKQKKLEYDPADEDPLLQARLDQNKLVAMGKEADLLQRFANMESEIPGMIDPNLTLENDSDNGSESEEHELNQDLKQAPSNTITPQKTVGTVSCIVYTHRVSKDCSNTSNTNNSQKPIDDLSKTRIKSEFCDNNDNEINKAIISSEIPNEDTNMKTYEDSVLKNNITDAADTSILEPNEKVIKPEPEVDTSILESNEKVIKQEPEDIAMLLEELGDNYTSTIIDIEDPFLVIEISSDSSDDESEHGVRMQS